MNDHASLIAAAEASRLRAEDAEARVMQLEQELRDCQVALGITQAQRHRARRWARAWRHAATGWRKVAYATFDTLKSYRKLAKEAGLL